MIELNGIQISDNNINTKKNVKIYVDEKQLDSKVGKLSDLKTTNKSSIVNAINEVKDTTDTLQVDVNRIYSDFTIIPNTPTEQEFIYKKSDEGVIEKGVAVIDKMKGNSVVWNQLWQKEWAPTATQNGITLTNNGDGSYTANGTANGDIDFYNFIVSIIGGHKYLLKGCPQDGSKNTYSFRLSDIGYDYGKGVIGTSSQTKKTAYEFHFTNGVTCSNLVFRPQIIDLTQMFGAGNEPTTYEEFLSRKPKVADEYAYNEGTIVNNKVEAIKAQGRNLATSDILLSTSFSGSKFANAFLHRGTYCISLDTPQALTLYVALFDKNGNNISSSESSLGEGWALNSNMVWWYHTIDSGGKLSFSLANDAIVSIKTNITLSLTTHIMLNMGTTLLPYEPYEKHELDLSWVKEIKDSEGVKLFEDGLKSAGTVFDEAGAKKAVKRIGVVDLGSLDISKFSTNTPPSEETKGVARFFIVIDDIMQRENFANQIVQVGYTSIRNVSTSGIVDGTFFTYTNKRVFYHLKCDASNYNKEWFKEQMQGQYLYYELAEPIEVEYDEKNLSYPVVAGGTEEAIASEPSTHMRASITYGSNTVATILSLMNRVNELERKIKTNNL